MADANTIQQQKRAAEQGDAHAQYVLGCMYTRGQSVAKNDAEAVAWYRKAAEQGHAAAQCNLGWMYASGRGVDKDDAEAVVWYRKAAVQGHAVAQHNLGLRYAAGRGVDKDDVKAVYWYQKAAVQGQVAAQYALAKMYESGKGVSKNSEEALRWYEAAAAQGNEEARKSVVRLKAALPPAAHPPSQQEGAPANSKRKKVMEQDICKPLLEACTSTIYRHNAFRVTGLQVDATPRQLKRRIDDLKAAEELGDADEEHTHAFALNPLPSINQLREATQRMNDPERRIIDEFFWFWPLKLGHGAKDPAIAALVNGDKDAALSFWVAELANENRSTTVVAKHNIAVMFHLVALDSEQVALDSDLSNFSSSLIDTVNQHWRISLKWWEELADNEIFWSIVTDRIRMLDDPRLTTGFARRMRATFPMAMAKINAMVAIAFIEIGKHDLGKRHVDFMLDIHQGQDDALATLAIALQPHKTRVINAVDNAKATAAQEAKKADQSVRDLLNVVAAPLNIIRLILPHDNHERNDLCDSVAEACLTCLLAYARESRDWTTCVQLLEEAKSYAASPETGARLEESLAIAVRNQLFAKYLDPLVAAIKKAETRSSVVEKLNAVNADVLPLLNAFDSRPDITAEVAEACSDLVAHYVRGLSVAANNELKDIELASRAHALAKRLARDKELQLQIQNDAEQLAEIRLAEMCWFCKTNRADEASKLNVAMHGHVRRNRTFGGTRVTWQKLAVTVPRCKMCKEAHKRSTAVGCTSSIAGAAIGSFAFPIGTIIGFFAGWGIGEIIGSAIRPSTISSESAQSEYPPIKKLLAQGWAIGEKPYY